MSDGFGKIIRGGQAEKPLRIGIVGGGKASFNLLRLLDKDRSGRLKIHVLGVSDVNPEAPGLRYAKALGIFATSDYRELLSLTGLNLIIELTGSPSVREAVVDVLPPDTSFIDHRAARLFWDLIQLEADKMELEKERLEYDIWSKKHTQLILDSLPYRIMVVNLDMTVDAVNETFLRHVGVRREDVIGRRCHQVRYGLDRPCNETGGTCYLTEKLDEIRKKGFLSVIRDCTADECSPCFEVITVAPIYDEKGEIVHLLEASKDVTERIQLERDVQKSKVFLQNVIDSSVDGIVVVDTKGNVLIFNEGMERLTGYTAHEIKEHGHLSSFYDIEVAKENMRKMRSSRHGPVGKLNPTSMTITNKAGDEIPVTLSASLITVNGEEIGSVGAFTDMREILKMKKDLEEAHFQLVQSEKIASVGRMAAGVAHEINNPLAGILMYSEMLKEYLNSISQDTEDVEEIINQTIRCKRIVSQLLEFSRQSVGEISFFNLEELIHTCLELMVNQAAFQDIEVCSEIEPDLPLARGDPGQLQQVFTNLFINAADAMEGKGRLSIEACFKRDKKCFLIRINDTGPGIPESLYDNVFDMFFTTKAVGKGTGLGLSISKKIIDLHGGSIRFECPPRKGTAFIIELPLESEMQHSTEPVFVGLEV